MHGALRQWHDAMPPGMTMLVEYKPFEPAFYHTDIADWGMAYIFAKDAGPRAKVLVDTGHHLQGTNIEQIVAFLLDEDMLGGFHFNDRKYADDDLTLGSIDPYAVFRIFHEIRNSAELHEKDVSHIAYMIDQSHNLKPKIEAMIQTVTAAQELFAKACLVDRQKLRDAQTRRDIVTAEECLRAAFFTDVRAAAGRVAQAAQSRSRIRWPPTAPAATKPKWRPKENPPAVGMQPAHTHKRTRPAMAAARNFPSRRLPARTRLHPLSAIESKAPPASQHLRFPLLFPLSKSRSCAFRNRIVRLPWTRCDGRAPYVLHWTPRRCAVTTSLSRG